MTDGTLKAKVNRVDTRLPSTELTSCVGLSRLRLLHPHIIQNLKAGDVFVAKTGGGAGVGPPEERDPEAVRMDVKNELVSIEMARDIYKVVLNPDNLEIDFEATRALRS